MHDWFYAIKRISIVAKILEITLSAQRWGCLKAGLTQIVNISFWCIEVEIASESAGESKDLLMQLKARYNTLEAALIGDVKEDGNESLDYNVDLDTMQQHYSNARAAVVKKLLEVEEVIAWPTSRCGDKAMSATLKTKVDKDLGPFTLTASLSPWKIRSSISKNST